MAARPTNLLLIMSDEHNPKALGCYGHPLVKTPYIDRLAAAGTRFDSAYTNCPICAPARASFATGRYIHETGYWDFAFPYDGRVQGWGHRLQATGHRVTSIGKLHYRNPTDPTGIDEQIVPMHVPGGAGDLQGSIRDEFPEKPQSRDLAARVGPGNTSYLDYDRTITRLACRWLEREAPKFGERPWLLFVSFVCPHYPFIAPPEFFEMYPLHRIPPPKRREDPRPSHPWWEAFENSYAFDRFFEDDERRRTAIAAYCGLCSFMDENVGKILRVLEVAGLKEGTRVAYLSDHGDNLGARGLWGKSTMYEESAGVPLVLSGAEVPRGKVVSTPVSLIDFFPTILECVGESPGPDDRVLPGESLLGIARRPDAPARVVFSEYHAAGAKSGVFMLRRGRFKYIHYLGFPPELFDLEADPEELTNLSASSAHQDLLREFEAILRGTLDPEAVDRRAKEDQSAIIARHGGREAVRKAKSPIATPAPALDPRFISE